MNQSHWHRLFPPGIFLAIIGSAGIVQAVIEVTRGDPVQVLELFERAPSVPHLRAFEARLEDESWIADQLRPATAYWRYNLVGDTGDKALKGLDDWWFYRDGVHYLFQPVLHRSDDLQGVDRAIDAIVQFRDDLQEMNIELLVIPVPGKASIYPDKLTDRLKDPLTNGPTRLLIDALRQSDVEVVDLFTVFAGARSDSETELLYLPRDTHWTPHGLELASQAVARHVREMDMVLGEAADYRLRPVEVRRRGDIVAMLNVKQVEESYAPTRIRCEQVISQATGAPFVSRPDASILALGDSFCRIYEQDAPKHAGFIAHVAHALQQPITWLINDGGASTLVRQELSRKPQLLEGKRLVIWEFVERDVRYGNQGWQRFRLTRPADHDTQSDTESRQSSQ